MLTPARLAFIPLLAIAGCRPADKAAAAEKPASRPSELADLASGYHDLQSMTAKPVYVDPGLAMLCRGASQKEVEAAQARGGPHAHTAVRIYMNDAAAGAFRDSAAAYPVGSIVVKEKKGLHYRAEGSSDLSASVPDGVGGMIKRPAGYDPEHGDWEYFYFEDPSKIESGRIASCVRCHAAASGRDYVFGDWAHKRK